MKRVLPVVFSLVFWLLLPCSAAAGSALPSLSDSQDADEVRGDTEPRDYLAELYAVVPEEYRVPLEEETAGGAVGAEYLFSVVWDSVTQKSPEALRLFCLLLGTVILGGVASLLTREEGAGMRRAVELLISAVSALLFYSALSRTVERVGQYLDDLRTFLNASAPILTALLAAGGSTGAAAASASSFSLGLVLLENLMIGVLTPLTGVCFAMALVGAISPDLKLEGITRNLRWVYMTVLGAASALSVGALTFQTTLASSGDSVAIRGAKYAVGNMIPLVGNSIGAALGTLGSSLSLVKSTAGVSCVAVLLLMTLPVLVDLFLIRLAVSCAGAVASLIGFSAGESLLAEFRRLFDMLLAITAVACVSWILYFTVFLKTAYPTVS